MDKLTEHIEGRIKRSEVLLIGCSAGGFNLVSELVLSFPPNFPLAVIVVIHRNKKFSSTIETMLNEKAKLPVRIIEEKDILKPGNVYYAPADYHLLLEPDHSFTLDVSEPVNFCRPAIDIACQSLSDIFFDKIIGVLLSGANHDGAEGMKYIASNGGLTIVQDPADAEVDVMPKAALEMSDAHLVYKNSDLFNLIDEIVRIKKTST